MPLSVWIVGFLAATSYGLCGLYCMKVSIRHKQLDGVTYGVMMTLGGGFFVGLMCYAPKPF